MVKFGQPLSKDEAARVKSSRRSKEQIEGETLDYDNLPHMTEDEFYNWMVFGTKTEPKAVREARTTKVRRKRK